MSPFPLRSEKILFILSLQANTSFGKLPMQFNSCACFQAVFGSGLTSEQAREAGSLLSPPQLFLQCFEMMKHTVFSAHCCSPVKSLGLFMHQEAKHIHGYLLHDVHSFQNFTCLTINLMFLLFIVTGWEPRICWHLHTGFSSEHSVTTSGV